MILGENGKIRGNWSEIDKNCYTRNLNYFVLNLVIFLFVQDVKSKSFRIRFLNYLMVIKTVLVEPIMKQFNAICLVFAQESRQER